VAARGGIYRDALEAVQARIDEIRRDVGRRRGRMRDDLLAALPPPLVERIRALEAASQARAETPEEHRALLEALEALEGALDEAIALAPGLEDAYLELPDTAPELPVRERRWSIRLELPWMRRTMDREVGMLWGKLKRLLLKTDPAAELRWSIHAFQGRFRASGDPFSIVAEIHALDKSPLEVDFAVATSVARGAPRISVAPEGWAGSVAKAFVTQRDAVVGDDEFDGLFSVKATERDVRRVLTREVRAALLALAHFDVPRMTIEEGEAVLRWCFEPEARALDAAVRALSAVRRTPVELSWLDDE
jgi:hypothetical protein